MSENDTACVAEHRTVKGAALPHHATGGAIIVSVHGEMDAVTAPTLIERFDALTAHPHPDLVLDLRSVTFIDCAGLGVLCRARNRALARCGRLRLITQSARFRRVLRATGLGHVFEVHERLPRLAPGPHGSAQPR
ncbi:STAS domain-containing protein [Streptomyces echinatus]|uniref:Anti-sigma factor antagonist n=1 Tax=Streptomyces echinatus TaxID=67293 RepID=A0A7W9PS01_9ACTN|nr:STAS domain-containing protein [Streptomyces echinatus]MBB5926765.1 anti-sigma B factor antagonist [Streptomyces echinatus]